MKQVIRYIPLIMFVAIIGVCWFGLGRDPTTLPSALIGKPVPAFNLPTLKSEQSFQTSDLKPNDLKPHDLKQFAIVHVWATWCPACRAEHPILVDLARQSKIPFYAIAYKDEAESVRSWLTNYGNPYKKVGLDEAGQVGIEWGIYGTPETFLIDNQGVIRYRHTGKLTHAIWEKAFKPYLKIKS